MAQSDWYWETRLAEVSAAESLSVNHVAEESDGYGRSVRNVRNRRALWHSNEGISTIDLGEGEIDELQHELLPCYVNRQILPQLVEIFEARKRSREHPVDVERAGEMVNLMLQNPCVPSLGFDTMGLGMLVQKFNRNTTGPRNNGRVPRYA
jgi:hypothetical protein